MSSRLASIQRHPIKAHGREALDRVTLAEGQPIPWDRRWAVAHERSKFDRVTPAWVPCANFVIGAKTPALVAIDSALDEASGVVTLTHPARPSLTINPDDPGDQARFLDWVAPLCPEGRPKPAAVVALPDRGLTDTDYPSISVLNLASNADLSRRMGVELSPLRWRGNLWVEGFAAWEETAWIGRELQIGAARLRIEEPITRCKATTANPTSGERDADTLAALREAFGNQVFGLYARVVCGGSIAIGDPVELLQ